uniref:CRAL-TRIO domain-containing protein n=1 Tax=Heterosigma akashiwo TaxID=2829 RepID=A0A7S3YDN9_HETAK
MAHCSFSQRIELLRSRLEAKIQNGEFLLSQEEQQTYQEYVDDECLRRYLVSTRQLAAQPDLQLESSAAQIIETVRWRVDNSIRSLGSEEDIQALRSGELFLSPGVGREGQPILVSVKSSSKLDYTNPAYMRSVLFLLEKATHRLHQASMKKWIIVCDLQEWTPANSMPMNIAIDLAKILQAHYCQLLHKVYIINMPWIFNSVINLLSPFIHQDVREKIVFIRGQNAMDCVSDEISPDDLHVEYGGKLHHSFDFNTDILGMEQILGKSIQHQRSTANADMNIGAAQRADELKLNLEQWFRNTFACIEYQGEPLTLRSPHTPKEEVENRNPIAADRERANTTLYQLSSLLSTSGCNSFAEDDDSEPFTVHEIVQQDEINLVHSARASEKSRVEESDSIVILPQHEEWLMNPFSCLIPQLQ